jgi:hypothetical protein
MADGNISNGRPRSTKAVPPLSYDKKRSGQEKGLPEPATKFSAHGAIFAKDVTMAERFDSGNEDHDIKGLTQTEFDTVRKDTDERGSA